MIRLVLILLLAASAMAGAAAASPKGALTVEGTRFVVTTPAGARLTSRDLIGAVLEMDTGQGAVAPVRIDAVEIARESPATLLHALSGKDPTTKAWSPMCEADAYGRAMGFPLRGRWEGKHYVADPATWFLTCSSGSQGKCVLWGYDPWASTPAGVALLDYYRTCQQLVRADYLGDGQPHTRSGTAVDVADAAGVQAFETLADPAYVFEAGWGPDGAVCVAATRWPDLLTRDALLAQAPALGGVCDEATARARGALMFTRVKRR